MIEEFEVFQGKKYIANGKASIEVTAFGFRILVYGILDRRELEEFVECISNAKDDFEQFLETGTWK